MSSHIRRLKIERFRGIESLTWLPCTGINILLGGGDVGKTTILDAVALLLNPTNTYTLSDADYWRRDVDSEFVIEAVMSLSDVPEVNQQSKMNWPWEWNEEKPALPLADEDDDLEKPRDSVYILRVRGTSDLELAYEVVQTDDSLDVFSVTVRRAIGLVRLAGDDRNDRDLRLVHGSGLDRLLSDKALRSRIGRELATEDLKGYLNQEAQSALCDLDTSFGERALPTNLGLGITGGQGISVNALVGLTAKKDDVTLPLASWGAGTRRLAALAIADALQTKHPITVVDEIEKGLEPYRQRILMESLRVGGAQVFMTTHSASIISSARDGGLWYLDAAGKLGRLPNKKIARHQKADPDMFLARLTVVAEGATELGFSSVLLQRAVGELLDYGVWISDAGGHESALELLEALADGGLCFAAMVDNEGSWPTRWKRIEGVLGDLLVQWPDGCLEHQVLPMFERAELRSLIEDPEGTRTGLRRRSLAERLEIQETDIEHIMQIASDGLTQLIIDAATGSIPPKFTDADKATRKHFQGHAAVWYKSKEGGRELAEKVFQLGAWQKLQPIVLPFLNAVRKAVGLDSIEGLPG